MSNDVPWTIAAITRARLHNAAAPEAVWTMVEALLKGKFSERPLSAGELATAANTLIAAMISPSPKGEGPQ